MPSFLHACSLIRDFLKLVYSRIIYCSFQFLLFICVISPHAIYVHVHIDETLTTNVNAINMHDCINILFVCCFLDIDLFFCSLVYHKIRILIYQEAFKRIVKNPTGTGGSVG